MTFTYVLIQYDKMIKMLLKIEIDENDIRIITNLYSQQKAHIRIDNRVSEKMEIARGVWHICILSPLIFKIYSEKIFAEVLDSIEESITVNGVTINNLRYADDIVIMVTNAEDHQCLLESIVDSCARYDLTININKTKYMLVSKQQHQIE